MIAYKLFRQRKDGSLGPLFINRTQRLEPLVMYKAEDHPTLGYQHRPGWHCCRVPIAPHLKLKEDRVWAKVDIVSFDRHQRPDTQGGIWYIAKYMTILEVYPNGSPDCTQPALY